MGNRNRRFRNVADISNTVCGKVEAYVSKVTNDKNEIEEYIKNQIQEDLAYEQMSLKEYIDLFTGKPVKKGK